MPGEGGGDAGDGRGRDADDALQGTNNGDGLDPARPFARRGGGARELRRGSLEQGLVFGLHVPHHSYLGLGFSLHPSSKLHVCVYVENE